MTLCIKMTEKRGKWTLKCLLINRLKYVNIYFSVSRKTEEAFDIAFLKRFTSLFAVWNFRFTAQSSRFTDKSSFVKLWSVFSCSESWSAPLIFATVASIVLPLA